MGAVLIEGAAFGFQSIPVSSCDMSRGRLWVVLPAEQGRPPLRWVASVPSSTQVSTGPLWCLSPLAVVFLSGQMCAASQSTVPTPSRPIHLQKGPPRGLGSQVPIASLRCFRADEHIVEFVFRIFRIVTADLVLENMYIGDIRDHLDHIDWESFSLKTRPRASVLLQGTLCRGGLQMCRKSVLGCVLCSSGRCG